MAAGTMRERLFPPVRAYQLALALALAVGYALAVTGYVATGYLTQSSHAAVSADAAVRADAATPAWSKPLNGLAPYQVQRGYGASGGVACDLAIYTTNTAALEGNGRLRPGDTTATVCVVRKARTAPPKSP